MSLPYIRFSYEESLYAKKQILSAEINLLNAVNKLNNYNSLRKSELAKKTRLRTLVRENLRRVASLINELPVTEGKFKIAKKQARTTPMPYERPGIESELAEIRAKLQRL